MTLPSHSDLEVMLTADFSPIHAYGTYLRCLLSAYTTWSGTVARDGASQRASQAVEHPNATAYMY